MLAGLTNGRPVDLAHLCEAAVILGEADGAALAIMLPGLGREPAACTDAVAAQLEELITVQGDRPRAGIVGGGRPRLVGDLAEPRFAREWPLFTPAALEAGVRAFFTFPIHVGAIELGALDVYRRRPGSLEDAAVGDLLALVETAASLLLDQARPPRAGDPPTPPGGAGARPGPAGSAHPEVHQATGMVGVQLGVPMAEALSRLRAHAFAHDRPLRDVAHDVVTRALRFDREPDV